jgi:hypothetical protein
MKFLLSRLFQYYFVIECIIAALCEVNNESTTTRVYAANEYIRDGKKVIEQMTPGCQFVFSGLISFCC